MRGSRIYTAEAEARGVVLIFWQERYDLTIGAYSTQAVDGVNEIPNETDVLACLADSLASFRIDPDRVHLVGFSQGGKGGSPPYQFRKAATLPAGSDSPHSLDH